MGILDRLFGAKPRRDEPQQQGVKVVPLADREPLRSFTTELVGVTETNPDGRNRQHEIAECEEGEEVVLLNEPRLRGQPPLISVFCARTGKQIGRLGVDVGAHLILQAKRHDYRTTIASIETGEDQAREVTLKVEVFAKP